MPELVRIGKNEFEENSSKLMTRMYDQKAKIIKTTKALINLCNDNIISICFYHQFVIKCYFLKYKHHQNKRPPDICLYQLAR